MLDKIIAAVIIAATAVIIWVVTPSRTVGAAPPNLSIQDSLGALVPVIKSDECINAAVAAATVTLVASGTALHQSKVYDISSADNDSWCVLSASETAATQTGRHFPKVAIVPGRFPGAAAYISCYSVGGSTMTLCPNGS